MTTPTPIELDFSRAGIGDLTPKQQAALSARILDHHGIPGEADFPSFPAGIAGTDNTGAPDRHFLEWPKDRHALEFHFRRRDRDAYVCPNLFSAARRTSGPTDANVLPSRVLFQDLDRVNPWDIPEDLKPTIAWRTSPGSYQAVWLLGGDALPVDEHREWNRRLQHHLGVKDFRAPSSFIRVPGRRNRKGKYGPGGVEGILLWDDGPNHDLNAPAWQALPEVASHRGVWTGDAEKALEIDADAVVRRIEGRLPAKVLQHLRRNIRAVDVDDGSEGADRRHTNLWILEKELRKAGCSGEEIFAVMWNHPYGQSKFGGADGKNPPRPQALMDQVADAIRAVEDDLKQRRPLPTTPSIDHAIVSVLEDGETRRNQLRWALRFAKAFQGQLIHTPARGWLRWSDSHWETLDHSPIPYVNRLTQHALMHDLPRMVGQARDELYADIRSAEKANAIKGILTIAESLEGIAYRDRDLDQHPDLWVCRGGTLNLITDEFGPSRPEHLITMVSGCDYDPEATCPVYDEKMIEWQPDPAMRRYIHRIVGSALQGRATEQTLPVFWGNGANGKGSTVNDAWLPVFGEYGDVMGVEVLLSNPNGNSYLPQKAAMLGKRLIVTSEPTHGARFAAGTLKLLTGGDPISAAAKYKDPIKVMPTWQVLMLANDRPEPSADDAGVWRRLRAVNWGVDIPDHRRDTLLHQKLAAERAGIFNRMLEGWRDYRDHGGIREPESVREATKKWREDVDYIGHFLAECCVIDPHGAARFNDIYREWERWCSENGEKAMSAKALSGVLVKKKFIKKRDGKGILFRGLSLACDEAR